MLSLLRIPINESRIDKNFRQLPIVYASTYAGTIYYNTIAEKKQALIEEKLFFTHVFLKFVLTLYFYQRDQTKTAGKRAGGTE